MLNRLLVVVLAGGCASAENALTGGRGSTEGPPPGSMDGTGANDTGASATTDLPEAAYYGIDLTFVLEDNGNWTEGATTLAVSLFGSDLQPLCAFEVPVLAVGQQPPPLDDPAVYGWWQLDLGDGPTDGCPSLSWPARRWWVGVGAYDVRLDPALDAEGLAGQALYGLYLREAQTSPIYVFGYAVHAEQADTGAAVGGPPLPPGAYEATTLVLMSAPPG